MPPDACRRCGADDWYVPRPGVEGRRRCRPCVRKRENERQRRNPRDRGDERLVRMHGAVVLAWRSERMLAQGGACAICGDEAELHVDHDHITGRLRGLLCGRCNRAIGLLRDEPDLARAAALYLEAAA